MSEKFVFLESTLPDFICEPIKYLSVLSKDDIAQAHLPQLLLQSQIYKGTNITNVMEIINAVLNSKSTYYSLEISRNNNKLTLDSRNPSTISLVLDEYTFNHHSYAGRYIRFTKSVPAKGSPEFIKYHKATVKWGKSEKYMKDLISVVSEVFTGADILLLSDPPNPFIHSIPVQNVQGKIKTSTSLYLPEELCVKQISDEISSESPFLDPEDSLQVYEFLCLLHLNSLPNFTNSHVQATSLYEFPKAAIDLKLSLNQSKLVTAENVNPLVYYRLAKNPDILSVQATTATATYLTLNIRGTTWTWVARR